MDISVGVVGIGIMGGTIVEHIARQSPRSSISKRCSANAPTTGRLPCYSSDASIFASQASIRNGHLSRR